VVDIVALLAADIIFNPTQAPLDMQTTQTHNPTPFDIFINLRHVGQVISDSTSDKESLP
jgi:hypothetical protein